MIAALFNNITTPEALHQFSFANADLHARMTARLGLATVYVLDPIPTGPALTDWLWRHQEAHNLFNAALGIAGNDLTDVDFQKPDQLASWVWLHAQEHYQAANKLGIS
ncbi:MAG: hypothetical protein KGL35_16280 [Bradyrhizobium sp.]|nr:hypothetical protein [Bradyrhizobium sp.]